MPTVLITGANRGIGLALATQYAGAGWRVHATARDPKSARELRALAGDVHVLALDANDDGSIRTLAGNLKGEAIDVLFNNAGIAARQASSLGHLDAAAWAEAFRVNAIAPVLIAEALANSVAASRQKKMAMVSTQLGSIALNGGGRYAYGSSKAALNMAGVSLARDLRGRGIAVVLLHPGHVRTDMGGSSAPVSPAASATGMRRVVDDLTLAGSGQFINYDGMKIPW
ncbi:MAG: SDR family oxidoreductase [Alphaproteobacteria bacterium]|nr:SDR family oxidoreductase [Alphaproteobacteria bacterium]